MFDTTFLKDESAIALNELKEKIHIPNGFDETLVKNIHSYAFLQGYLAHLQEEIEAKNSDRQDYLEDLEEMTTVN